MSPFLMSKGPIGSSVVFGLLFFLLAVPCCKKGPSEDEREDPVIYALRKMVRNPIWPADVIDRADSAISRWKNGSLDPEPIVINAWLTKFEAHDEIEFIVGMFDEDKDVLGVGIEERHMGPTGQERTLEENYPVYVHRTFVDVVNLRMVPFRIRTGNERKNEQVWQKYAHSDPNQLLEQHRSWKATVPPVWVSRPEAGEVDVWIYVYDQAGNKSEPVKLLDSTKRHGEN